MIYTGFSGNAPATLTIRDGRNPGFCITSADHRRMDELMGIVEPNPRKYEPHPGVTGPMTLGKIWPEEYAEYQRKIDRALHQQIPDAIQAKIRENVANGQNPGESMTDGEYDAMAGHAGGLF